jgi:hypothetical protein
VPCPASPWNAAGSDCAAWHPSWRSPRSFSSSLRPAATAATATAIATAVAGANPAPSVLRVGTYHGIAGQYRTIQAANDAAHPGDWVLVDPGGLQEASHRRHVAKGSTGAAAPAGVLITSPDLRR